MVEAIKIFIDLQRRIFCELGKRLQTFKLHEENQVANLIYSVWVEAYELGRKALERFEAIAANIEAGNLDQAQQALGIPPAALPPATRSTFLYLVLINEEAPYSQFLEKIRQGNRLLTNNLLQIASTGQDLELCQEVETLATWIATFPHPEDCYPEEIEPENTFFSSLWETGLKVGAGFVLGRYIIPPKQEPEYLEPQGPTWL